MDGPHRRDINELLVNGYFRNSRAKSPSGSTRTITNLPSSLEANHANPRARSRSREPPRRRGPPPPRPTVEDEVASLRREFRALPPLSHDPPLRGIIDQHPIILEAEVSAAEVARLQAAPCPKENEDNADRRFVFLPRSDTHSPNHDEDRQPNKTTRQSEKGSSGSLKDSGKLRPDSSKEKETARPPIERRRSRQDLPSLQTKAPRELPPQFRRSTSAYASTPKGYDETLGASGARTPMTESFLSPDVQRAPKDYFGTAPTPRHASQDFVPRPGTPASEKRVSAGGSIAGSRPGTPLSEKRNSGNFETGGRSRRNSNEKVLRPQQLSEDHGRRGDRHPSHSDRHRHSRVSAQSHKKAYSSSEDDISNSDSDHHQRMRRHRHYSLYPEEEHRSPSRSNRSSLERPLDRAAERTGSRFTSPLASPNISPSQLPINQFEKWEPHPVGKDGRRPNSRPVSPLGETQETPRASDRLNPMETAAQRPGSRQSSTVPIQAKKPQLTAPPASLPMAIPSRIDLQSPGDSRRTPSFPQFDGNKPASTRPDAASWQPPPFQPPSSNLDKPVGSFRRYSEEIERGAIVPLPSCPRTTFTRGRNDWLTLPQCPSFDICPSCFNSTIAPTEFRAHFVQAPPRSSSTEVLCDFGSSPWYRIAWLLTLKDRRRDLKLFYGLAHIAKTAPPCLGKHEAVRQWHSIVDPKTRTPIQNFDVCYSCVKSIETLLPPIRGIFIRTNDRGSQSLGRVCDLRFDSKRFIQYFDALETTADKADDNDDEDPDIRSLASLVRRLASFNECERDKELVDVRWHVITQLPEFTVCEECFDDVVWPELDDGKAIPAMFNKKQQILPRASCQLYSERMRAVFSKAVNGDDYKLLASKSRERKSVELAYRANLESIKRQLKNSPQVAGREIERITGEWKKWE